MSHYAIVDEGGVVVEEGHFGLHPKNETRS